MPATIGDAFTLIGNAAMQLVGTWDQGLRASSLVATSLIAVADNMERLAAIGIVFAGFMDARWSAAFIAVGVATLTLSGALTVLRGAIVRTGSGAGGRADLLVRAAGAGNFPVADGYFTADQRFSALQGRLEAR